MIRGIFIDRGNWAIAVATGFCLFGLLKLDGSMMPDVPCSQFPLGAHFEGGVFALSYRVVRAPAGADHAVVFYEELGYHGKISCF
jgi:hypothetical protein